MEKDHLSGLCCAETDELSALTTDSGLEFEDDISIALTGYIKIYI